MLPLFLVLGLFLGALRGHERLKFVFSLVECITMKEYVQFCNVK